MLSITYVHTFCCYDFGISGIYIINMIKGVGSWMHIIFIRISRPVQTGKFT